MKNAQVVFAYPPIMAPAYKVSNSREKSVAFPLGIKDVAGVGVEQIDIRFGGIIDRPEIAPHCDHFKELA